MINNKKQLVKELKCEEICLLESQNSINPRDKNVRKEKFKKECRC